MTNKFYITTPLYYVNAKPHIGHAYTNIICDSFARYHRLKGERVFFLTGTDEHGTKIEKAAREQSLDPKAFVDSIVPEFKSLWETLGIDYDYFIRTTDPPHKKTVQVILKDLEEKGDIYKANYKGWYCTPCESFWTELQLVEQKCPDCQREVQELSEENYFFKLSKYQDWLIKTIEKRKEFIQPEKRRNEMLGFLKEPLEDLCITRPKQRLAWGIEYPGAPDHVVYVWFDALLNYISAVKFNEDKQAFKTLWPADVQVVGKDILRHHAVYWPIMLRACELELPQVLLAHGWWTMAGAKVSKSRGNIVDPVELVKKYGVDAFRYFLLNEVTLGNDGAYSEDLLRERYTTDLANDLGNLWFRVASMLGKYFDAKVPDASLQENNEMLQVTFGIYPEFDQAMIKLDPRAALAAIWKVIRRANQFIEEQKPWVLAKDEKQKDALASVLRTLLEILAHVAIPLRAFLPETAYKILDRLQLDKDLEIRKEEDFAKLLLKVGTKIERGEALFPKLEDEA